MEPATAITVELNDASDPKVYDFFQKAIGPDPHHPPWDCSKPSSYNVAVVSAQPGGSLKEVRNETILAVTLEGNDPNGNRWTYCTYGNPGRVYLVSKAGHIFDR